MEGLVDIDLSVDVDFLLLGDDVFGRDGCACIGAGVVAHMMLCYKISCSRTAPSRRAVCGHAASPRPSLGRMASPLKGSPGSPGKSPHVVQLSHAGSGRSPPVSLEPLRCWRRVGSERRRHRQPAWWILRGVGVTLVNNQVVSLSTDIALADTGQQEASDCVLDGRKDTSSPTMAISLLPSVFLKFGFMNIDLQLIYPSGGGGVSYGLSRRPEGY